MSYQDAVNAYAFRRAATLPHFRSWPGPLRGPREITVSAGSFERLESGDVLVHQPLTVHAQEEVIATASMDSSVHGGQDPAYKGHHLDFGFDARLDPIVVEGFHGSEVTPAEPDEPALRLWVRCGTCGESVATTVSVDEAIRGVLETGR